MIEAEVGIIASGLRDARWSIEAGTGKEMDSAQEPPEQPYSHLEFSPVRIMLDF